MNASLNNATAEPALSRTSRGLHLTAGTVDYGEHMDHGVPVRVLKCDFPKDFGTQEERDFLVGLMNRLFDDRRLFSQCSSDCHGFNVTWRIWSLLQCADNEAERQRVVDILNAHRESDMPEIRLEVEVEGVLIYPGRRRKAYGAEMTRIYLWAGEMRSYEHLRREVRLGSTRGFQFRTTIYK